MGYNGFVKLSANILQSSIMLESPETFKCWITILASCDSDGVARISPVFLMSVCHLDKETVLKSLNILESPDQLSRSQNEDGRRIKRIDGGYEIINYHKYRDWTYSSNPDSVRKKSLRDRKKAEAGHVPENAENSGHVRTPLSSVFCNLSSSNNTSKDSTTVSDINTSSENSNSSDSKIEFVKKKEKNVPEFAMELAKYLKEKIVESGTDMVLKESHLTGWANDFRLMVTVDKKTVEDIRKKIDDVFNNEFWSKQIRSAGKLREQWNAGKLDNLKQRAAAGRQQTNEAEEVDRYASEKRYDSGRCRRYIDAMLRRLFPGDKWEEYIIPETDAELEPIWEIIVADGGFINGVKTKEAALKIVGLLRKYS